MYDDIGSVCQLPIGREESVVQCVMTPFELVKYTTLKPPGTGSLKINGILANVVWYRSFIWMTFVVNPSGEPNIKSSGPDAA